MAPATAAATTNHWNEIGHLERWNALMQQHGSGHGSGHNQSVARDWSRRAPNALMQQHGSGHGCSHNQSLVRDWSPRAPNALTQQHGRGHGSSHNYSLHGGSRTACARAGAATLAVHAHGPHCEQIRYVRGCLPFARARATALPILLVDQITEGIIIHVHALGPHRERFPYVRGCLPFAWTFATALAGWPLRKTTWSEHPGKPLRRAAKT